MSVLSAKALGSGLIGAAVLTVLHETARQVIPQAPRADLLGMQAIAKAMHKANQKPPEDAQLHRLALAGDLVSNALFYALVGAGDPDSAPLRGAALGAAAGAGAVFLPGPLGLSTEPSNRTPATQVMTVAWYTIGGLVAAIAYATLSRK